MPTALDQDASQRSVTRHGIRARWDQNLGTDVCCARVEMCNEARLDVLHFAVKHEGINQAIAIVHIVVQLEVRIVDEGAPYGSRLARICAQHDLVFRRQDRLRTEKLPRATGKRGHHEVGMRPGRPVGCEPECAWSKRGEHAVFGSDPVGIQIVEVPRHRVHRGRVRPIDSGWPIPTPSRESVRVFVRNPMVGSSDQGGVVGPHLTIAVATTMVEVISSARSTTLRSLTDRRPIPSHPVV